jgi:hypothetical protein
MADLISVGDIELALGREVADEEEEAEWQRYITLVSRYIKGVSDYGFEPLTVTERLKADSRGEIKLRRPVTDIISVTNYRTGQPDLYVDFDGLDTLFYLEPHQVVDVTYSYGFDSVPADIAEIAVSLVLGLLGENTPTNIQVYQVGDVKEQYSTSRVEALVDDYISGVLDNYRQLWFSIPLAVTSYPDYRQRGYLDDFN